MDRISIFGDEIEKGLSLALGNFDGVHLGHQQVFKTARSHGALGVVSFTPHPRRYFAPTAPAFELMDITTKERVLRELGAKAYHIKFDETIAALEAEAFLDALGESMQPKAISCGENFQFGHNRGGNGADLENWGARNNVQISLAPLQEIAGVRISSSAIREALLQGDTALATRLLGRPHIMAGVVTKGDQRGRELGFPTANIYPKNVMLPKFGIYASRLTIHDGAHKGTYQGASSLGVRPTFGVNSPNFETHILDFSGDIYGAQISVELISYLRGEEKFDSLDALIAQMDLDVQKVRAILSEAHA